MPRMTGAALSVAANSVSANVVAGKLYEFLTRRSRVLLSAVGSAAGLKATLVLGGRIVVNDEDISGANRFPTLPDDAVTEEIGTGRIILTFRNTTAGALTVNWALDVT